MTTMTIEELLAAGERDLGASPWRRIEQPQIDRFADATGDHQWIHVDPKKAASGPFGTTVAHGYLTLSLLPDLMSDVLTISDQRMGVNYGIEKLRFTAPVPSGSQVRLHAKLISSERRGEGVLFRIGAHVEIEGQEKPALVGEALFMAF